MRKWIGFDSVDPHNIMDHFIQFFIFVGGSCARQNFVQLLWLASVLVLWTERNNMLFKLKERSIVPLLAKVQLISFWGLKAKYAKFPFGYHLWWQEPLTCLGIC